MSDRNNTIRLETITAEKDIGVWVTEDLNLLTNGTMYSSHKESSGDATPGRARAYALVVNASDLKMTWW